MTSVFNYMFNNLTRTHDDSTQKTEQEIQNVNFGNYSTSNYYLKHAGMAQPISFATSQPNVFYKGGHGALNGSTVDAESNLLIGTIQTNMKCKLNLQPRQYLTVPYLGRGMQKPVLEAKLQQGMGLEPKKSCKTITERSYSRERTYLVEPLQKTVQNPSNLIESSAHEGWIRGGLPSRQLAIETALRSK
jgi:hypothetical protein